MWKAGQGGGCRVNISAGGRLGCEWKLPVVAAPAESLILGRRQFLQAWVSGTAKDADDTLTFNAMIGVQPVIERYPLAKAAEGCQRMITGKAKFPAVRVMAS